jgi:Putative peptidoglycan binding domain
MLKGCSITVRMRGSDRRVGRVATLLLTFALFGAGPGSALATAPSNPPHPGAHTARAAERSRGRHAPSPRARHPERLAPKRTVLLAQRLFRTLGYPLGRDRPGELGVATTGALRFFQRKYGLTVSGYPTAQTLARMAAVEASLHGASSAAPAAVAVTPAPAVPARRGPYSKQAPPRDLIERLLGDDLPFLGIAVVLASLLAALALSARGASGYRLTKARDSVAGASEEG